MSNVHPLTNEEDQGELTGNGFDPISLEETISDAEADSIILKAVERCKEIAADRAGYQEQVKGCNQEITAIHKQMEQRYGIPTDMLKLARKQMDLDEQERREQDLGLLICRRALKTNMDSNLDLFEERSRREIAAHQRQH